jgi:hypothetical protein
MHGVLEENAQQLCSEMLGVCGTAPVSAPRNFLAIQDCAAHLDRFPFQNRLLEIQGLNDLQMLIDDLSKDFQCFSALWLLLLGARHRSGIRQRGEPPNSPRIGH